MRPFSKVVELDAIVTEMIRVSIEYSVKQEEVGAIL
jgi:hypothetical protein